MYVPLHSGIRKWASSQNLGGASSGKLSKLAGPFKESTCWASAPFRQRRHASPNSFGQHLAEAVIFDAQCGSSPLA